MLRQSFSNAHDMIHIKGENLIQANNDTIFHLKKNCKCSKKVTPIRENGV